MTPLPPADAPAGAPPGRARTRWSLLDTVSCLLVVGLLGVLGVLAFRAGAADVRPAIPAAAPSVATVAEPPALPDPLPALRTAAPAAPPAPTAAPPVAPPVGRRVDPQWAARVATATGIGDQALLAYATAVLRVDDEQPSCRLGWNTLAGIGAVESRHGTIHGSHLDASGHPQPPILGVPLDGHGVAAVPDTDGGRWDGDPRWDRAVGPMQFIPSTWEKWQADGNGDGVADPNQIDDAALAAARYLCAAGPMTGTDGWRAALWSYNRSDAYAASVAQLANQYAQQAQTVTP